MHEDAPGISTDRRATRANRGHITQYIRVLLDYVHQGELMFAHRIEGNVFARFGNGKGLIGILTGEKAFGDRAEEIDRRAKDEEANDESREPVTQDELKAQVVTAQHAIEELLRDGIGAT